MLRTLTMKNFIRKLVNKFTLQMPKILENVKNDFNLYDISKKTKILFDEQIEPNILQKLNLEQRTFGPLNEDKIFYVIKRTPGTGMFSNITFILNHLKICKKYNFIPVVDMKNFKTIYNERVKLKKTFNAWNYYFENLNQYSLEEVYKSKNVLLSDNKFLHFFSYNIVEDEELTKLLNTEIKVNKYIDKCYLNALKKFKNKNILGIHFRGTSYKRTAGHPLPATKKQMYEITNKFLNVKDIDNIFLVTEEKDYLEFFKKKYGKKLIYLESAYRSNKNDAFKIYPRNLHRYKLGREAVLEAMLLSSCKYFIYLCSNISSAAISFNIEKKQKRFEIDNGFNSKNILFSQFYWYFKKILPENLGGFKNMNYS